MNWSLRVSGRRGLGLLCIGGAVVTTSLAAFAWRWSHLTSIQIRDEMHVSDLRILVKRAQVARGVLLTLTQLEAACQRGILDERGVPILYVPLGMQSRPTFILIAVGRDGTPDQPPVAYLTQPPGNVAGEWDRDIVQTDDKSVQSVK